MARLPRMRADMAVPGARFLAGIPRGLSPSHRSGLPPAGGAASELAEKLLAAKVLKQSDWDGQSIASSLDSGLKRWVNHELGARELKIFQPFGLVYGTDLSLYYTDLDDQVWRREFSAIADKPIAFFALFWNQERFTCLNVREQIEEIEAAFPGVGFGLLNVLQIAFRWTCNGFGFEDGLKCALEATEHLVAQHPELGTLFERMIASEGDPVAFLQAQMRFKAALEKVKGEAETYPTADRFLSLIPQAATSTPFDWKRHKDACEVARRDRAKRKYLPLLGQIETLVRTLNRASRTWIGGDHTALIGNGLHHPVMRNSSVYLCWDEKDEMHRIVDDITENGLETGALSDISWLHGYQIGHPGRKMPDRYRPLLRRKNAGVRILDLDLADPDETPASRNWEIEPVGTLDCALGSVRMVIDVLRKLDRILQWVGRPVERESEAATMREALQRFLATEVL